MIRRVCAFDEECNPSLLLDWPVVKRAAIVSDRSSRLAFTVLHPFIPQHGHKDTA